MLSSLPLALVEHQLAGRDRHYYACVPSKALLRSGHALCSAQHVDGAAQAVTSKIGVEQVLKRRNRIVDNWIDDRASKEMMDVGIDIIRGKPAFAGKRKLSVISSNGGDAMIPDIEGIDNVKPWNNREATGAQQPPQSLLLLGGGAVGCEMATAWITLGSKVTPAARDKLLGKFEPFVGGLVGESLVKLVDVRLEVIPISAVKSDGKVTVSFDDGSIVSAAEFLIATGRSPRTDLNFESIGFPSGDWLHVDDTVLVKADTNTSDPWLYALGDANNRAILQHQGKYQARVAANAINARAKGGTLDTRPWGKHTATADTASVPQVIFADPGVATVGLTESVARERGYRVTAIEYDLGKVVACQWV